MIRPFRRSDREQLTGLVNAHIAAVVPGVAVSVNALMSQLEREPDEALVDPWVAERRTLVAVENDVVVAGALLLRYADEEKVGPDYRGAAEIRWLVHGPASADAGDRIVAACLETMDVWGARRRYADGSLPGHFVYGVPEVWPHIRATYVRAGFVHGGRVEIVLVAGIDDLPRPPELDLELRRSLGTWTRLSGVHDGEVVGYIELETDFTAGGALSRYAGWADIGNLWIAAGAERSAIGAWLLGHAADWLRLGHVDRLVTYAWPEQKDELALMTANGFRELVRTERGWERT